MAPYDRLLHDVKAGDDAADSREHWQARLLMTVALAIANTDSLELAIVATLRAVCEATGWVLGEAWLPRDTPTDGPRLEHGGSWGGRDRNLTMFASQAQGFHFGPGEGLPGTAWNERHAVWVRDLANDRTFTRGPLATAVGIRAAVAIPVIAEDAVVAVLSFYMIDPRHIDAQLVELTTAVAAQLGTLIRRKEAEDAHRSAEAQLAGMVAISVDAIISCDESRRITLFNWGAEQIFGYAAADIVGESLDMLLPADVRARHAAHIAQFARSATTARRMGERSRIVGMRKNGEVFPAEASISRFMSGAEWRYTVMLRDVSAREQTEEGLRAAVAARDQVLAVVSHDLRNPLSAITMCVSALRSALPAGAEAAASLLGTVRESTELMQRIIQDLLDVASIDAGRLSLDCEIQPVAPILERAVEIFRPLAEEYRLTLTYEGGGGALPEVALDADRMLQVLSNLIGNACKFSHPGGQIRLAATGDDGAILISVSDTGSGIDAERLPRVFDRFWQPGEHRAVRSTGLGLAIAKGIIEAHGGRIWVESRRGVGSTFFFTLPAARAAR
jgi:PAS domain S-box-containing protein